MSWSEFYKEGFRYDYNYERCMRVLTAPSGSDKLVSQIKFEVESRRRFSPVGDDRSYPHEVTKEGQAVCCLCGDVLDPSDHWECTLCVLAYVKDLGQFGRVDRHHVRAKKEEPEPDSVPQFELAVQEANNSEPRRTRLPKRSAGPRKRSR